jgi:hypothetical protein
MVNRLAEPIRIMNDYRNDYEKMKEEFSKLDNITLFRFKNYLTNGGDNHVFRDVVNNLKEVIDAKIIKVVEGLLNEDDGGAGSTGTAMVGQGSVSGMGNVVSAQPGVVPGTFGTDGSGDIGVPFNAIGGSKLAQKIPSAKFIRDRRTKKGMSHGPRTGKPSRLKPPVTDLKYLKPAKTTKIDDMKPKKVMSYNDFQVDTISTVTNVRESINEGAVKHVMMNLQEMTNDIALSKLKSVELGLKDSDLQTLSQFISDKASEMVEDGSLEPVFSKDMPIDILSKSKLDTVTNLVNDILFGRK